MSEEGEHQMEQKDSRYKTAVPNLLRLTTPYAKAVESQGGLGAEQFFNLPRTISEPFLVNCTKKFQFLVTEMKKVDTFQKFYFSLKPDIYLALLADHQADGCGPQVENRCYKRMLKEEVLEEGTQEFLAETLLKN